TLACDISSSPRFLSSERSCSPLLPSELMNYPPCCCGAELAGSVRRLRREGKSHCAAQNGHAKSCREVPFGIVQLLMMSGAEVAPNWMMQPFSMKSSSVVRLRYGPMIP